MNKDDGRQTGLFRAAIVLGGLLGAAGVMAAAGASHAGESRNLQAIATIALAHGPALLALGLAGRGRVLAFAAAVLAVGTALFVSDLGFREWQGTALFPGAAPLGGGAMILGWLGVVAGGLTVRRSDS